MNTTQRLAQLELLDAEGRVQQAWDIGAWPVSIGRALDNQIVLHDPQVAAQHALLDIDGEGRLVLTVGASRNGVRIEEGTATLTLTQGQRTVLAPLAAWHVGTGTLRVRRAEDPLADEQPLIARSGGPMPRAPLVALAAALLAWMAATLWLQNDPTSTWEAYLPPLVALIGGVLAWAALWGLASKLFTRRFAWLPHLRIVLMYALAAVLVESVLGVVAYAADWPWASRSRDVVSWAIGAAMLAHHLRLVAPAHPRRVNAFVGGMAVMAVVWTSALHWQRTDRVFEEIYLATLPPPSWRLAPAQTAQTLIEDLRALEAPLLERAREAREKDAEP